MNKFLIFALAVLVSVPAWAGNSIRLSDTNIGAGTTTPPELLCVGNTCNTDGDLMIWDETNECFDCVECADNEIVSFDTATNTWVCDINGSGGGGPCVAGDAPVDNEILTWDTANTCYTSLSCTDEQMLSWEAATAEWVCVDAGNLCNAAGCTDNALIQWNSATNCYDCKTCAADEILQWNGSDWDCIPVGFDDPSTATCLDDTVGDVLIGDDLEVTDQAFVGDELGVNTCDIDRTIASNPDLTGNAIYNMHVFNHILEGATASNQPEINTLFEAHIDSVSGMNYLGLARYFNVGGADLAMNFGLEVGSLGWFAWNGTELQIQGEIGLLIDATYDTGALAADTAAGTIFFRHGNGVAGAGGVYSNSAFARYDLDWEFNDDVFLDVGLLGFGGTLEANTTCIIDDGSDELFGDRDCDEVVDTAENPLDTYFLEAVDSVGAINSFSGLEIAGADWNDLALLQGCADGEVLAWDEPNDYWECATDAGGAGEANADTCMNFSAGQMDALEAQFASLGTDLTGTHVTTRYRAFDPGTDEYINHQVVVPDSLAATGNVTITLWTRGDATADSSGLDVIWSFDYVGRDDAETYDAAYASSAFAAETYTTVNDTTLFEVTQTIAVGSFTAGDLLYFRVWRDADNASDTYNGDAHILAAEICWPQD
jgi:hypothetical protein